MIVFNYVVEIIIIVVLFCIMSLNYVVEIVVI